MGKDNPVGHYGSHPRVQQKLGDNKVNFGGSDLKALCSETLLENLNHILAAVLTLPH